MLRLNGWKMGARISGVGIMVLACVLSGCGEKKGSPKALVLARVGDREITEADFKWEVERRQKANQPGADKSGVLDDLVRHEALLQKARAAGIEADPQVRREVSNLLIGDLMDKELRPKLEDIPVSPGEIKSEYDKNKTNYTRPAQIRLAVLKLEIDPKATEARKAEVRKRMDEARSHVLADPPRGRSPSNTGFGRLAVDYSDDQASRYRGGDIGWIETGRLPPRWPREVLETGLSIPLGQISGVIEAAGGVYLVTKTDSREAVITPLAEVEASIRQHVMSRKRQDMEAAYRDDVVRRVSVVIDTNALAALDMPLISGKSKNEVHP